MILLLGCQPEPGSANGRLVDARYGPIPGAGLRLSSSVSECESITTITDVSGAWYAGDLCGQATWTVAPTDSAWYLPEPASAGRDVEIRVWRAPESAGVYLSDRTSVTTLPTHTVLDGARVFGTEQVVRFPVEIPGEIPRIVGERALLLVGDVLPELAFEALVPSLERRWFGSKAEPRPVDPWTYLGVRFLSDTEFERVPTHLDAVGVEVVPGDRAVRYVSEAALPPGRYALPTADGARAWLFDFGVAE